jgi:hypothetical protein
LLAVAADAAAAVAGVAVVAAAADAPAEDIPPPPDRRISLPLGRQVEAKRLLDLLRVAPRPRSRAPVQPHSLERARLHSLAPGRRVEPRVQAQRRDSVQLRVPGLRIALPEPVQPLGS